MAKEVSILMYRRANRLALVSVSLFIFSTLIIGVPPVQGASSPSDSAQQPKIQLSLRAKICLGTLVPALGLYVLHDSLGIERPLARAVLIAAGLTCTGASLLLPYPHILQIAPERIPSRQIE